MSNSRELSDIGRDFPKLFDSDAVGCAIYYVFLGERIKRVLQTEILRKYQRVYEDIREEFIERHIDIKEKWFRFFVCAYKEGRMFTQFYRSVKEIDFYSVEKIEIVM